MSHSSARKKSNAIQTTGVKRKPGSAAAARAGMPTAFRAERLESRQLLSAGYALTPLAQFGAVNSANGATPYGTVVLDSAGNLYGTTRGGGVNGAGVIFEVIKGSGKATALASFAGTSSLYPQGLVLNSAGDLFGITRGGGTSGAGSIFELPKGASAIQTVASFDFSTTGGSPAGRLLMDSTGNLFGTTQNGAATTGGSIWELPLGASVINVLATLPTFPAGSFNRPEEANGDLVMDASGNLYGTSAGDATFGLDGSIFELPQGSHTVQTLATFNSTTGINPLAGLAIDSAGNLFGTTSGGAIALSPGTIFELAKGSNQIQVLAALSGATGTYAQGQLVVDSSGNLFGTAAQGGDTSATPQGYGTAFELPAGAHTVIVLATFTGTNGGSPSGGLLMDAGGNFFGDTQFGSASTGAGNVFELVKGGVTQPPPAEGAFTPTFGGSTLPASLVGGAKTHGIVSIKVTNTSGASTKGAVTVKLFASADGIVDGSAVFITSVKQATNLKAGKAVVAREMVKSLPASLPNGTYTLVAQVIDSAGKTAIAAGPAVKVAAPFVSLALSAIAVTPGAIKQGKGANISFVVTNSGNVDASGPFAINIGESTDGSTESFALQNSPHALKVKVGHPLKVRLRFLATGTAGSFSPFVSVSHSGVSATGVGSNAFTVS